MSLYDEKTQMVILPYFATNDSGVKDYWRINTRKMVVIKDNRPINVYSHNIGDIETMINDKNLYYQIVDPSNQIKRRIEINNIDKRKYLSSKNSQFTTNFTTKSPAQLAPSCSILPRCQLNHIFYKFPKFLAKQGIPRQNNDKSTFHLPRHSRFTIMQSFTKWGNIGQNVAQTRMNTTVSTTKAHR